jgi:preprotein translocase SecE subunit
MQFIKDSWRELKHVVWPTKEETRKYFFIVVLLLIVFGIYLFVFSNLFSFLLFKAKDMVNPSTFNVQDIIKEDTASEKTAPITIQPEDIKVTSTGVAK